MATVQFHQADEFLDELEKERGSHDPTGIKSFMICRLTNQFRSLPNMGPLRSLSVVATFKTPEGDIVRLDRLCGTLWNMESQDQPVWDKAQEIHNQIINRCKDLVVEVRAGVFEG